MLAVVEVKVETQVAPPSVGELSEGVPQGPVVGVLRSVAELLRVTQQITWCLYCARSSACFASSASSCAFGGRENGEKSARGTCGRRPTA